MKCRRPKRTSSTKRNVTYTYHVRCSDGNTHVVYNKAFCGIHAIGKRRVERLCEKLSPGELIPSDARGTHKNRPHGIPEEVKQIREHIQSFPRWQSHYSRAENHEYFSEGLSIAEMHRLYLSQYEESTDTPTVKEWLYRKIFNEDFNLNFGYTRSDTCQMCDELRMSISGTSSDSLHDELCLRLAEHQLKASQGYQSLRSDTELAQTTSDVHTITFDLQQNLPVPTLTHSSMFYLRQLWVYNFGIHVCGSGSAIMCVCGTSALQGVDQVRFYHAYFSISHRSDHKQQS